MAISTLTCDMNSDFWEGHRLLGYRKLKKCHQGACRMVPNPGLAGPGTLLLAPVYNSFFLSLFLFFLKERNIRKTFALTLNPPPRVTVIAGPGEGKKVSFQFGANQP